MYTHRQQAVKTLNRCIVESKERPDSGAVVTTQRCNDFNPIASVSDQLAMKLEALPWLILFLPLLSAVAITLFTQKNRELSAKLSIGAIITGFVLSVVFIAANGWEPLRKETLATWL